MIKKIIDIIDRKWDYYYLKNQLTSNKIDKPHVVISGSSYGIFGLEPKEDMVNICLPSQDIYYSVQLVKRVIEENCDIRKVCLCFGYYSLFHDVSKSKEQWRVDEVYYPLLKDSHNKKNILIEKKHKRKYLKKCIKKKLERIIAKVLNLYLKKHPEYFDYFVHTRKRRKFTVWQDADKEWIQLEQTERDNAGKKRAYMHEKQLKYKESMKENLENLESLYQYCKEKNIELVFCIFPFSIEYKSNMSPEYWEVARRVEDIIKKYCDKYIDFNRICEFDSEDFVDCDHLSNEGAKKMTQILVRYF